MEKDFIRLEVVEALEGNCNVYPVLINDAKMPLQNELPPDVQRISELNALEIRHSRFNDDIKDCLKRIFDLSDKHFSPATVFEKAKAILA